MPGTSLGFRGTAVAKTNMVLYSGSLSNSREADSKNINDVS